MLSLEHYGITDAGKVRQNNEDSLLLGEGQDTTLFAVADGIGGFEAGEVASSIAVETLKELRPEESFDEAVQEANRRILSAARDDEKLSGMGTTVVAIRFPETEKEPAAEIAHVGDSRAYLLREDELKPLTEDHSLVAEMVRSGDLTRAQAAEHPQKNLITRALGAEEAVEVDTATIPIEAGDRILLCSDGLSDMVTEDRISEVLSKPSPDPETPVRQLLSEALEAGGTDNVTIVLLDVKRQEHQNVSQGAQDVLGDRSSSTREMQALSSMGTLDPGTKPQEQRDGAHRRRAPRSQDKQRRKQHSIRLPSALVRLAALVAVIVVAITPVYLWGSSRYYLGFEDGEIVAYRGVPYEVLGVQLNEEWNRPGIKRSEVKTPYQQRIEEHQLYDQDEVKAILEDLAS